MYIPYGKQSMDEADIQAVIEVLKSDFLTTRSEERRVGKECM